MAVSTADLFDIVIDTEVAGASPRLLGVLGVPEGNGPWPAVVVVHEAFGIDAEMRKQVAHLARLGYLAVMPDLFSAGGVRRCLTATMRALRSGGGRAFADIEAARRYLIARDDATGAVGVIGFCMGGGFALMAARDYFDAAASNYGLMPANLDEALENACPVVASYGAKDSSLKGAAAKLEATLTKHAIVHDVKEYPTAGHVFMNEALSGPLWMRPLMRVMNFGPEPDAAADAWSRIDRFFMQHLTPPR